MSFFRLVAASLVLVLSLGPLSAMANDAIGVEYDTDTPEAFAMAGDLLIARPLLLAATAVGTAVFVVTLPFSWLSGSTDKAGKALVVEPARATFVRCLGCKRSGYKAEQ